MTTKESAVKKQYNANKEAKVGDVCVCPSCRTEFTKTQHQQAFCKSKAGTECKDKYWNTVTPTKRNNKTRISPASARFMATQADIRRDRRERSYEDNFHPHEDYALGQW